MNGAEGPLPQAEDCWQSHEGARASDNKRVAACARSARSGEHGAGAPRRQLLNVMPHVQSLHVFRLGGGPYRVGVGEWVRVRPPHPRRKEGCRPSLSPPRSSRGYQRRSPDGAGARLPSQPWEGRGRCARGVSSTEGAGGRGFKCAVDGSGQRLPTEA